MTGFIITWDVESRDRAMCGRLRRFIYGNEVKKSGKVYRYPGFIHREGVVYVGQSVLFVTRTRLPEIVGFLHREHVDHHLRAASVGSHVRC